MKRTPGLGVRAKTNLGEEFSEFVIREKADGNETISLLQDEDLIQIVTSKRDELGTISIKKHMISKNLHAFSHYRYDWLDTTKFLWWGLLIFGLILLLSGVIFGWGINLGIILFIFGLFFTLLQAADPEYIVFETSSSSHRFLVYRFGSNLQLTNFSMEIIDDVMQEYLRSGKLNTSQLDSEALAIEEQRIAIPNTGISVTVAPSAPPPMAPSSASPSAPPPMAPSSASPSAPPPMAPPSASPSAPPPMAPPSASPSAPPPMAPPSASPSAPPPMAPPSAPPPMAPPSASLINTNSEFSEIPPPPPVDFSDIPVPPQINELESVSEQDKNELLDVLK